MHLKLKSIQAQTRKVRWLDDLFVRLPPLSNLGIGNAPALV